MCLTNAFIDSSQFIAIDVNFNNFRRVLPANVSSERMLHAIYQTSGFVDNVEYDIADLELLKTVFETNRYSVRQMMATLQQPCDELFVICRWEGEIVPCGKLFQQTFAYYGNCCTFNRNNQFAYVSNAFDVSFF